MGHSPMHTTDDAGGIHEGARDSGPSTAHTVRGASTVIQWDPKSRVAFVRYERGANLRLASGVLLVDALTGWIAGAGEPFAVLADAAGLDGTDAEYRATASAFFRKHRDTAHIALINVGPVIHVIVEMFRVGTGIQLKTFGSESAARSWLRTKGIAA